MAYFNMASLRPDIMGSAFVQNGHAYGAEDSIPHQKEKNLPGGANWVVQKFGGTSVGKFAGSIADIVQ
jgi:aspartate kinase